MSQREEYEARTESLVQPILNRLGLSLYDVEYVKEAGDYYLRIYIDKEGGVTINDCVDVTHEMNEILDKEDFIPDAYTFEVSSPGLCRVLKKDKHFQSVLGQAIEIKTYKPINDTKEFEGVLDSFDKDQLTLNLGSQMLTVERSNIAVARLAFDFEEENI